MTIERPQGVLTELKLDQIQFDDRYQRPALPGHKKIAANFDASALGYPLVGRRADKSLQGVDGRQRLTALRLLGWKKVWCEVFESDGVEHEAQVFKLVNVNRTALKPLQLFHAMLVANDPTAKEVKRIVERHHFVVAKRYLNRGDCSPDVFAASIQGINTCLSIYRSGKEPGLDFVMKTLSKVWPLDPLRVRETIMAALFRFWQLRSGEVDIERLADRLNTVRPLGILQSADEGIGSRSSNAARVIDKIYRKRPPKESTR